MSSFQPTSMFLYGSPRVEMHWSAGCSRALLEASGANNKSASEHEQFAAALLASSQQQQASDKLNRLLAAAVSSSRQREEEEEEEERKREEEDEEEDKFEVGEEATQMKRQESELEFEEVEEEEEEEDEEEDNFKEDYDYENRRNHQLIEMDLEAEQETALNLSLNNNQRNKHDESLLFNKHEHLDSIKKLTNRVNHQITRRNTNDNSKQHQFQDQHLNQIDSSANKNSSFITGNLNHNNINNHNSIMFMATNETYAQSNKLKLPNNNNLQQQFIDQQITHLNSYNLTGSSGSTPTSSSSSSASSSSPSSSSSLSSSSSSSSYSASSYSLSSASSTSSTGGWSAADSLASCSPERVACISSPPNSAASLLGPINHHQTNHHHHNQQQQQQQQLQLQLQQPQALTHHHLNTQRPLFLHHHHHHHHHHELGPVHKTDSDDLDRIRNFIEQFKARRGALGLTQKQAAQCFRAYTNDRYAFSDNFVGHFEGFQFRPQTAMTIADSLAEWLEFAENETRNGRQLSFMPGKVKETRKRKYEVIRIRDSAKRVLVEAFEKNKSPSTSELEQLSRRTNIPSRNIEIFFKNRRTSRQYHQ